MHFHIITIFPKLFDSYLSESIIKRASDSGSIHFSFYDPRSFTKNKHKKIDDIPYGGGPGMVMMVQPIIDTWESITKRSFLQKIKIKRTPQIKTIILSPGGTKFTTNYAKDIALEYTDIIFICGRYEGVDGRVQEITKAELISIGDYILTGGELAAMVMCDSISRQIEGVLGNKDSLEEKRISSHEVYTRPSAFVHKRQNYSVPDVLLNGNHKDIDAWREKH
jgi:tRNA (guanine37-N1)-methyltransferase